MQWVIDLMTEWAAEQGFLTTSYVDRGDPAAWDFDKTDFLTDGAWHELDLSSIVPAGAKAASIFVTVDSSNVALAFMLRKHGNANVKAISMVSNTISWVENPMDMVVAVDADRKIDYYAGNLAWRSIMFCVKGWWL